MNLLRKCYDMTDFRIGHSYQHDKLEFVPYLICGGENGIIQKMPERGVCMQKTDDTANFLKIDTEALARNAKACVEAVKVPVIGVVKFDGYGVGLAAAAKAWQSAGVTTFAVSEPWEALALRQAGFTEDVLLLAPVADQEMLGKLLDNGIILTVSDLENAGFYIANRGEKTLRVHVKVDTGMGRFGFRWDDPALLRVYSLEGLRIEGIFSHFGKSFEKKYDLTGKQLARFLLAVKAVEDAGFHPGIRHIANSCGALRFPQTHLDAVRIGSALVGSLLHPAPVKLESVHTFHARVVAVKQLRKGDTLGYASVCKAKKDTTAAVVALGFEHGYAMTGAPDPYPLKDFLSYIYHLWQRWRNPPAVTYQGKTMPLIGRVGSQYTLFDADGVSIRPGDFVTARMNLLQCTARREY